MSTQQKLILTTLMVVIISTPCFATELEGVVDNTLWEMNVFGIRTEIGFYAGEIYYRFPDLSNDFDKATTSSYSGNSFICFFMWETTSVGFLLPTIGFGFVWDTRYLFLPPALIIKTSSNWTP